MGAGAGLHRKVQQGGASFLWTFCFTVQALTGGCNTDNKSQSERQYSVGEVQLQALPKREISLWTLGQPKFE